MGWGGAGGAPGAGAGCEGVASEEVIVPVDFPAEEEAVAIQVAVLAADQAAMVAVPVVGAEEIREDTDHHHMDIIGDFGIEDDIMTDRVVSDAAVIL